MARVPMVTRTISHTKVKALVIDTVTRATTEESITIMRTPDDKKLLKAVESYLNSDTKKVVTILEQEVQEDLYGITEEEFVKVAKLITEAPKAPEPAPEVKPSTKQKASK